MKHTMWLYHPKYGGEIFRDLDKNALGKLEVQGWCDHPDKCLEIKKVVEAPKVEEIKKVKEDTKLVSFRKRKFR